MTDIIEVAKKYGVYVSEVNGKVNFAPEQLQAFADHYHKEGAEEIERNAQIEIDRLNAQIEKRDEQLAATELVVEQMREALKPLADVYMSEDEIQNESGGRTFFKYGEIIAAQKALQLHPSLSALREHEAKANKMRDNIFCEAIVATQSDVNGRLVCDVADMLAEFNKRKAASELRAKGDK